MHRVVYHSDNLSIKYYEQKFCIKFAFSGLHCAGLPIEKYKKIQSLRCLIKISISVLNFSTESTKKTTIYDFLFLIVLYSSQNYNKHPSEMRNRHHSSQFIITETFPSLGLILTTGLKN